MVLHRELAALGFTGGYQQVQRFLKPRRLQRRWQEAATIRFETGPGEQAQVDYGQLQVWIGEQPQTDGDRFRLPPGHRVAVAAEEHDQLVLLETDRLGALLRRDPSMEDGGRRLEHPAHAFTRIHGARVVTRAAVG